MAKRSNKLDRISIDELFSSPVNRGMLSFLEKTAEQSQERLFEKQKVDAADAKRLAPVLPSPSIKLIGEDAFSILANTACDDASSIGTGTAGIDATSTVADASAGAFPSTVVVAVANPDQPENFDTYNDSPSHKHNHSTDAVAQSTVVDSSTPDATATDDVPSTVVAASPLGPATSNKTTRFGQPRIQAPANATNEGASTGVADYCR